MAGVHRSSTPRGGSASTTPAGCSSGPSTSTAPGRSSRPLGPPACGGWCTSPRRSPWAWAPWTIPATEERPPRAEATPYAESKRAAEELALDDWGPLEVVVCNPTFVVGAYGTGTTSAEVVRLVASGLLVQPTHPGAATSPAPTTSPRGWCWPCATAGHAERYLLGGENLTYRSSSVRSPRSADSRPPRVPLPGLGGPRAGARRRLPGQAHRGPAGLGEHALPPPALPPGVREQRQGASGCSGYRPRPVRRGIREALRWYQEQGLLSRERPLTPRGVVGARRS